MASDKRTQTNREELVDILRQKCTQEGVNPIQRGLNFYRHTAPSDPLHGLYSPSICIIAQGAKEVQMGSEKFRYDPNHFLLCSLDVPVVSQVVQATREKPFLGLKLDLDPATISSVSIEAGIAPTKTESSVPSIAVSELEGELLDAFVRLFRLVNSPADYNMISPMVTKEIVYRLLKSEQGQRLLQMASFGGNTHRIARAIQTLQSKFSEALSIEDMAHELGMSVSSFHQHFKAATSMSPLQFQKSLRLQEARNLLLTEDLDASSVAARVGYDDASQFSREYKRHFGNPPIRDIARLKELSAVK